MKVRQNTQIESRQQKAPLIHIGVAKWLGGVESEGAKMTFPYCQSDEPTMSWHTLVVKECFIWCWCPVFPKRISHKNILDIGAQPFQTSYDAKLTAPLMLGGGQWSICFRFLAQSRRICTSRKPPESFTGCNPYPSRSICLKALT